MAAMILMAGLVLTGCASGRGAAPKYRAYPMTPEAQVNYDYLVYLDRLQQIQRELSRGDRSTMKLKEARQLQDATVEALDKVIAVAPSPQLYVEKAGLFWNHSEGTARSRAILKEGLAKFPGDRLLTVYLANSYVADDRVDDAIAIMDEFLKDNPDDIQSREKLGQMFMDAGRDAEALDVLKGIPEAERGPDALYSMGRVQGNLGMRKAAIANLKKAVKMDPEFTEAQVELAYQYELAKDYASAEAIYTAILEQNESFPEARLRLINLDLKLNNPDKALQLALDGPPTKDFVLDAVLTFINDGFYAQGSTVLDMLTSDGSVPAEYYFYKAVIANEGENDMEKALGFLGMVDKTDRLYPHALRFRAQILSAQGKAEEALSIAVSGKKLYPNAPIFYILEASLLKQEEDFRGAERTLKEGLKRLPNNPELTYELALVYEVLDRRDEGLALMESVIRAHPDHANALNYVGYTLAEEGRELDRALVLVTKASSLEPESGYILDSVAWVHFKRQDLNKAWEYIRHAIDLVDTDPTIWEHYGDIAAALGKKAEARRGYNLSLKFHAADPEAVRSKLGNL
jgi:tetratricopeptide (TPR) repeat protein